MVLPDVEFLYMWPPLRKGGRVGMGQKLNTCFKASARSDGRRRRMCINILLTPMRSKIKCGSDTLRKTVPVLHSMCKAHMNFIDKYIIIKSCLKFLCHQCSTIVEICSKQFPLPNQDSWTFFSPSNAVSIKVISVLWMQNLEMGEWFQPKNSGKHVRKIGVPLSDLLDWILGYRMPRTSSKFGVSQDSQLAYVRADMVEENKLQLAQSLVISRLLE